MDIIQIGKNEASRKYIRNKELNIDLELQIKSFTDSYFFDAIKYHLDLTFPQNKLSKDLIDLCHENRLKVGTYKINEPVIALLLSDLGVDYIYTTLLEEYKPN